MLFNTTFVVAFVASDKKIICIYIKKKEKMSMIEIRKNEKDKERVRRKNLIPAVLFFHRKEE